MTHSLNPTSPRAPIAKHFGQEMRKAMKQRRIGQRRLIQYVGTTRNVLRQYLMGYNLPRLDRAIKIAEALDAPILAEIARQGRTTICETCGKGFVNEGTRRRYCSELCQKVAGKRNAGADSRIRADVAEHRLADSLKELERFKDAVAGMCADCEPEGFCRNADCALRPISPLPLTRATAGLARPALGQWGTPEAREKQLKAIREGNAKRWAREGEREAQSARTAAMHERNREKVA